MGSGPPGGRTYTRAMTRGVLPNATASQVAAPASGAAQPVVWCHPHARGALVVEEADGRLYLLIERYGRDAWERRSAWRGGIERLMPAGPAAAARLAALGRAG